MFSRNPFKMHCNLVFPLKDPKLFLKKSNKKIMKNHLAVDIQGEKEQVRHGRYFRFPVSLILGSEWPRGSWPADCDEPPPPPRPSSSVGLPTPALALLLGYDMYL